jgi:hypothetical protein
MGYRSRVGICISEDAAIQLEAKIRLLCSALQKAVTSLFEDAEVKKQDDGCKAWYWDGFKWYSSDCDVAFLEGYLDDLQWDEYLYIRVGEDLDDVDYRGGLWDNPFGMCLTRGIEFNED